MTTHRLNPILRSGMPLLLLALILTSCTPTAPHDRRGAPTTQVAQNTAAPEPVQLLWHSEEALASDVVLTDEVAVAYVHEQQQLQLIARDLRTGELRWQKPARLGADPSGVSLKLQTVKHHDEVTLAFLEAVGELGTRVSVINPNTGDIMHQWGEDYWGMRPTVCAETWCVEGVVNPTAGSHQWQDHQLNWDTGHWPEYNPTELDVPRADDSRYLGLGLSSTTGRDRNQELLVFAKDGEFVWEHPFEEIFGPRFSSDSGWKWERFADPQRTLIGLGSRSYASSSESTYVLDWSTDFMTVALDEADGRVLWRKPGARADCSGALPEWVTDQRRTIILCQFESGLESVLAESEGKREINITGLAWHVSAVDTRTGKEHWSHPMPPLQRAQELLRGQRFLLTDHRYAYLPLEQGWRAVELSTGNILDPAEVYPDTVLCSVGRQAVKIAEPYKEDGSYVHVPPAVEPCTLNDLEPTTQLPDHAEFLRTGYGENEYLGLSGPNGMLLYRMPPSNGVGE